MSDFPRSDLGFFHLTPVGWMRRDRQPFPEDRIETWGYAMEQPAEDTKELVHLTRVWVKPGTTPQSCKALHDSFGEPVTPSLERNLTLTCEV